MEDLISKKQYFIFDLDGTLVDLEKLNYESFRIAVKELLGREFLFEEYLKYFAGVGSVKGFANYFKEKPVEGLPEPDVQPYVERYRKENWNSIFERFNPDKSLKKGVYEFINCLKEKGKKVAIATTREKSLTDFVLTKSKLKNLVDTVVTIKDVTNTKPDPEIFLRALELIGGNKEEAIIFEDSYNGMQAAKNSGMDYVVIHTKGINDGVIATELNIVTGYEGLCNFIW